MSSPVWVFVWHIISSQSHPNPHLIQIIIPFIIHLLIYPYLYTYIYLYYIKKHQNTVGQKRHFIFQARFLIRGRNGERMQCLMRMPDSPIEVQIPEWHKYGHWYLLYQKRKGRLLPCQWLKEEEAHLIFSRPRQVK